MGYIEVHSKTQKIIVYSNRSISITNTLVLVQDATNEWNLSEDVTT